MYHTGVADGVGGWWDYGIDSSKFSSALMKKCERFVLEGGLSRPPSPVGVIQAGFNEMSEEKPALFGKCWYSQTLISINSYTVMLIRWFYTPNKLQGELYDGFGYCVFSCTAGGHKPVSK